MKTARIKRLATVMALLAGGIPLATMANCDYGPGGGTFLMDRFDTGWDNEALFFAPPVHQVDVVIEDSYYDDGYYLVDDVYYDDYCDPYYWDCW